MEELTEVILPEEIPEKDVPKMEDSGKPKPSKWGEQYDKRDYLYSSLLGVYIDSYKDKAEKNKFYKNIFFWITMVSFCVIVLGSLAALIWVALKKGGGISDIAVVAGSAGSIISAIIVLPKIIAKHLFPMDEDKNMLDMVQKMQANDSGIREHKE